MAKTLSLLAMPMVILVPFAVFASEPSFQGLGQTDTGRHCTYALAISADGRVVVGKAGAIPDGGEAFRWTRENGAVGLGDLPGGDCNSCAYDVSADGSTVVGSGGSWETNLFQEPFRWTAGTGMVGLGYLPGNDIPIGSAGCVSADGSIVIGYARGKFRWTLAGGMEPLGDLPTSAMSADGSVLVGSRSSPTEPTEACRWTESEGTVGLGDLPGGAFASSAADVSADGMIIVGSGTSDFGREACRWTQVEGVWTPEGLGDLPGGTFHSYAASTSSDGTVVVGEANSSAGEECFYWRDVYGMQSLELLLTFCGLDLLGWRLSEVNDISADGLKVVGWGHDPDLQRTGWIATLPQPMAISAEADFDWVYQNTPVTTGGRHRSVLTVSLDDDPQGNTGYDVLVSTDPRNPEGVTVQPTSDPWVWHIHGGASGSEPTGDIPVYAVVRGLENGGLGMVCVMINVRPLGDVDGNGATEPGDVSLMINELNGLPNPAGIPDRAFDLDVNGAAEPRDVLVQLHVLNGQPVP